MAQPMSESQFPLHRPRSWGKLFANHQPPSCDYTLSEEQILAAKLFFELCTTTFSSESIQTAALFNTTLLNCNWPGGGAGSDLSQPPPPSGWPQLNFPPPGAAPSDLLRRLRQRPHHGRLPQGSVQPDSDSRSGRMVNAMD